MKNDLQVERLKEIIRNSRNTEHITRSARLLLSYHRNSLTPEEILNLVPVIHYDNHNNPGPHLRHLIDEAIREMKSGEMMEALLRRGNSADSLERFIAVEHLSDYNHPMLIGFFKKIVADPSEDCFVRRYAMCGLKFHNIPEIKEFFSQQHELIAVQFANDRFRLVNALMVMESVMKSLEIDFKSRYD